MLQPLLKGCTTLRRLLPEHWRQMGLALLRRAVEKRCSVRHSWHWFDYNIFRTWPSRDKWVTGKPLQIRFLNLPFAPTLDETATSLRCRTPQTLPCPRPLTLEAQSGQDVDPDVITGYNINNFDLLGSRGVSAAVRDSSGTPTLSWDFVFRCAEPSRAMVASRLVVG